MKKKYHEFGSLRTKILVAFFVIFLLFVGCSIIGYTLSIRNIYQLTIESMTSVLERINLDTSQILQNVQDRAVEVSEDADLQSALRTELPESEQEIYKERLNFNNQLYYESIRVEEIDGLYVVGENGALFHATYSMREGDFLDAAWYRQVVETRQILWTPPHEGSFLGNNLDFETISIIVPIQDRASTRVLGVVVADVLVEDLDQIVSGDMIFNGIVGILDENDELIYLNDDKENIQEINTSLSQEKERTDSVAQVQDVTSLTIGGTRYFVNIMDLSESDWKLMYLIPEDEVLSGVHLFRNILIGVSLLIMVLGTVFFVHASAGIVKPICDIQTKMKKMEKGDFTVRVEECGKDEVGDLARGFNHMIAKVNELVENEREMQEKVKQADFNALQAQINPHFLYNTLDSINWMARWNRVDKVEEMIDCLTSFLRIGLSRGRVFITLQEELKHVESYISIQKIRYQKILDYTIDVPEELYRYKVIKMILQPLVENSIYHGIKEKSAGNIAITGYETEEYLFLRVEDDGLGMTPERLEEVQEMMERGEAQNQDAYGIINVQRRIQSYFGSRYGLSFTSEYGKGTKVTLTLPRQEV